MRRTILAVILTAAGLALLLSFKTTAVQAPAAVPQGAGGPSDQPSRSAPGGTRTAVGRVVSTTFGQVQVEATLVGGRITNVKALQLPHDFVLSQQISIYAGPILRKEALAAQSAHIDTVSGATYTSQGYRQSLQAALDASGG